MHLGRGLWSVTIETGASQADPPKHRTKGNKEALRVLAPKKKDQGNPNGVPGFMLLGLLGNSMLDSYALFFFCGLVCKIGAQSHQVCSQAFAFAHG